MSQVITNRLDSVQEIFKLAFVTKGSLEHVPRWTPQHQTTELAQVSVVENRLAVRDPLVSAGSCAGLYCQ